MTEDFVIAQLCALQHVNAQLQGVTSTACMQWGTVVLECSIKLYL